MKRTPGLMSGMAIIVGLNKLDANHYGHSLFELESAVKDVEDYEMIAKLSGMGVQTFIGEEATKPKITSAVTKAAKSLKEGDFLLLTFSGIGGLVANFDGNKQEIYSATWCLYNSQMLLTELYQLFEGFAEGVNILVVSDTSSAIRKLNLDLDRPLPQFIKRRALPIEVAESVYLKNKDQYDAIYFGSKKKNEIAANLILIHACQVNQFAHETSFNGFLTSAIKHVWNGGIFTGNYEFFLDEVSLTMPPFQSPKLVYQKASDKKILEKKPFSI